MDKVHPATSDTGRQHCPNCGSDNWLLDESGRDGIKLHTVPPSTPGNYGCNDCGHSWAPKL